MNTPTQENPLLSEEPMKVAESFFEASSEAGHLYVEWRGELWVWEDGLWRVENWKWLEDQVWRWLEDAYVQKHTQKKGTWNTAVVRFVPDKASIQNIVRAFSARISLQDSREMPMWLDEEGERLNPEKVIAFRDTLVDAETGVMSPRDAMWFDNGVLSVRYSPNARCDRWLRCVEEWGGGDKQWALLLQRMMGYSLLPWRGLQRGFLWHGKTRGGKTTIFRVLQRLMGKTAVLGVNFRSLCGDFGLDGVQHARVLGVTEVESLDRGRGAAAAAIWKNIVGGDPLPVNRKFVRQEQNVICKAVPIMLSNQVPEMHNTGRGVSDKLVILPFEHSYLGREQFDLDEELASELPGIAVWALKGAMSLLREPNPKDKWPVVAGAEDRVRQYLLTNNPFDAFLEEFFVPEAGNFVRNEYVRECWERWCREANIKSSIHHSMLAPKLVNESSWDLKKGRSGPDRDRGIFGLGIRRARTG